MKVDSYDKYICIQADENEYVTDWNKEDIKDFSDFKICYCPKDIELSKFYDITQEEHNFLMEEQKKRENLNL